ncbi:hypothetical protein AVEN_185505-1 [Araneus ventricosus]|uniref:Uncharacterized protein n=1 Tax=Araneus ventricosus TaxID=182803 RepID=A0A4Y2G9S1_ARAVE|nr:hypothetical protein AVEN_185505-1 [Araneus ventricosus]
MNISSEVQDNGFVQFVFSYHNTRTVGGYGTFHAMGGMQRETPSSAVQANSCIPQPKIVATANVLGKFGFIPIVTHDWPENHRLNRLVMEDFLKPGEDSKIGEPGTSLRPRGLRGPGNEEGFFFKITYRDNLNYSRNSQN